MIVSYYFINKEKQFNINNSVSIGMCPDEVISKLGDPYFFDAHIDYTKWPKNTNPQLVIMKQCKEPDQSKFSLYFDKGIKYEISFENGKVTKIEEVRK